MRVIEQEFERYAQNVIPPEAGQTQREETRKAFYAGVISCFSVMSSASALPEAVQDKVLQSLARDIAAFAKEMGIPGDQIVSMLYANG